MHAAAFRRSRGLVGHVGADEARSDAERSRTFDQERSVVAARSCAELECRQGLLNAGLQARTILEVLLNCSIQSS